MNFNYRSSLFAFSVARVSLEGKVYATWKKIDLATPKASPLLSRNREVTSTLFFFFFFFNPNRNHLRVSSGRSYRGSYTSLEMRNWSSWVFPWQVSLARSPGRFAFRYPYPSLPPPWPPFSRRSAYPEVTNYPLRALRNDPRYVPLDLSDRTWLSLSPAVFYSSATSAIGEFRKTKCVSRSRSRFMARPRESRELFSLVRSFMNFYAWGRIRARLTAWLYLCLFTKLFIIY